MGGEWSVMIVGLLALNAVLSAALLLRRGRAATTTGDVVGRASGLRAHGALTHAGSDAAPTAESALAPSLTPDQMAKLEQSAEAAFQTAVNEATARFGHDLGDTSQRLNQLIVRLTTDVVERELEQYRQSLAEAREKALESLAQMQTQVEKRQQALQADADAELAKRRQYLMDKLDRKLGAAVSAYIVESLGQGADLGAQRGFLLDALERHKADLKKELSDEA